MKALVFHKHVFRLPDNYWRDPDYASDPDTRRSVSGYVLSLNGGPVSWKSKRQSCVTLSSAEAEFVAASYCGQEVLYLRAILRDIGCEQASPTRVWEDNASCIMMSKNPVNRERSRHIDTRVHHIRELCENGVLELTKVKGLNNVSDALTKSLPAPSYEKHRVYLWGSRVPFDTMYTALASLGHFEHTPTAGTVL